MQLFQDINHTMSLKAYQQLHLKYTQTLYHGFQSLEFLPNILASPRHSYDHCAQAPAFIPLPAMPQLFHINSFLTLDLSVLFPSGRLSYRNRNMGSYPWIFYSLKKASFL